MKLTLNELKILRNALKWKLRHICLVSSEFDDTNKSLQKVINEIERIENDVKQKDCDKSFGYLMSNIDAIDRLEYSSGSEPFIKIEVDYAMLKDGELETLLSFKDKNKNFVITFK